jgi:hypothetical protein
LARDSFRNDSYDPSEVYAGGAKDAQGHSANIRCHIPDHWVAAVSELVNSSEWPEYKTPQDFYRDAVYHRMRWASAQTDRSGSDRVRSLMALASGQASLSYVTMLREQSYAFLENARRTLSTLMGDGNMVAVRETIKDLESNLTDIIEPYRTMLRRELETYELRTQGHER